MALGGDRRIVVTGPRNQFSPDLEPGGSVSCMRSSLSFLSLVYDVGLDSVLSAEAVDGCLLEGRAWTLMSNEAGARPPRMCSAVELPNRIDYSPTRGLCCVFSRVYGDVRFFESPSPGPLDTQCSAHAFFTGPWALYTNSYSIITVGAVGLGVYRTGDDAYVFDSHGLPDGSPAFVARTRAGDLYTYLTYYTHGRADALWAGVLVFFVSAGPDAATPEALAAAALSLYGASETYLNEERFVERRVPATHPWRSDGALLGRALVGVPASVPTSVPTEIGPPATPRSPAPTWKTTLAELDTAPALTAQPTPPTAQPTAPPTVVEGGDVAMEVYEGLSSARVTARASGISKRRRPMWTPSPSLENIAPPRRSRRAPPSPRTPERGSAWWADGQVAPGRGGKDGSKEPAAIEYVTLRDRNPPSPPEEDLSSLQAPNPEIEAMMAHIDGRGINIAREADVCGDLTIGALRSLHYPTPGLLEHAIVFMFERVMAFLIENGARTHPEAGASGPAQGLLAHTVNLLPQATAVGDFLTSTGLTLSEVSVHVPLVQHVLDENSHVGRLALAKLVLVARDVTADTDRFHGELSDFERRLRGAPPRELYAKLSEWLMSHSRDNPGAMFAPATPSHPVPLIQRIQDVAVFAKSEEARVDAEDRAIRASVSALARGVAAAASRGAGALVPHGEVPGADHVEILPARPVATELESVRSDAVQAIRGAVREYFRKGAVYSAKSLLASTHTDRRFHLSSAAIAPVEHLIESLQAFDEHIADVAARAGVPPPVQVAHGEAAVLLRDLVRNGRDLEDPEALAAWLLLLADAAGQGLIDGKELEEFKRDVARINDRVSKRDFGLAELARFRSLDDALQRELDNEAAFGGDSAGMSPEVGRLVDDALRQAKAIEAGKLATELDPGELEGLAARVRELEGMRAAAREAADRERQDREALFKKLGGILRPLPGFAGLRAATAVLDALAAALPRGFARVADAAMAAPPETTAALRADLWALLGQYREALQRPTPDTATVLAGLPQSFTAVIDVVFPQLPEATVLRRFFLAHAQRISEALSAAVAAGVVANASAAPAATAATADRARRVLEEALSDLGPAVGPDSPLHFLVSLANDAAGYAKAAELAMRARAAIQRMAAAGAAAADLVVRVRRAAPDGDDHADLLGAAVRAKEDLDRAVDAAELEFGDLMRAEIPAGDPSPSGRALHELSKAAAAARRRAEELDAAAGDLQKKLSEHGLRSAREKWAADVEAALDRIDAAAEFDAAELRRLQALATQNGYNAREFRKRADQALATAARAAVAALEAAFAFNPYTPENQKHAMLPPLAAARGVLWGGAFHASADTYSDMFGVDVEQVARPLRIIAGLLDLAHAGGGFVDYHEAAIRFEDDLSTISSLRRYVGFFRRGYAEYLTLRDWLDDIRAEVNRAMGSVPLELERASEAALVARDDATAAAVMMRAGVSLACSGEDALEDAVAALGRVDQTPFADSAYAEYVAYAVRRDLGEAKDALVRAKRQRAEATEAVAAALREALAARERRAASEAGELANLKTMLHVLPPPATAGKTLDQARSVPEIVDQIVVILDRAEQTGGADGVAADWLAHALGVFETHPLTREEDGRPMALERHAPRIAALSERRRQLDDLRASLEHAEAEWDEAWARFARSRERALKSADDFSIAEERTQALRSATNTIQSLRGSSHYAGLPPKYRGALETKLSDRAGSLSELGEAAERHRSLVARLRDEVARLVPWEMAAGPLRRLRDIFDSIAKDLPAWAVSEFRGTRELIQHRLGLYTAYASGAAQSGPEPLLLAPAPPAPMPADGRALRMRGEARIRSAGTSAGPLVLREVASELDGPFPVGYLMPDGKPLQYAVCYPRVTDKLGAMLMAPAADCLRPQLPADALESRSTIAAMRVLAAISSLQLALADSRANEFDTFARFVRHRQAKWPSAAAAAAETYAALVAVSITRDTGARWDELGLAAGAAAPQPLADPPGALPRVQLSPEDVLVLLVAGCPEHIYNFWRLDLVRQHEYMQLTLPHALETSVKAVLLVRRLQPHLSGGALPTPAGSAAPTRGLLFGTRLEDWHRGSLSEHDPLAPWRGAGLLDYAAPDLASMTHDQALTAVSVLGRMCMPGVALGALWTCLRPDEFGAFGSFDALLAARLGAAAPAPLAATELVAADAAGPGDLYAPSGRQIIIPPSPTPQRVARVTAMDLVIAATLLGAPLVVALMNDTAFSVRSGLKLCLVLFDTRDGCPDAALREALSADVSAWASSLLSLDPHAIENACLSAQLPGVSALIAARPLARAPPCLVLVDISMTPVGVLWERDAQEAAPEVQFVGGDAVDAVPFVLSAPADEDLAPLATASDPLMSEAILGRRFDGELLDGDLFPGTPVYSRPAENRFPFALPPRVRPEQPRSARERHPPQTPLAGAPLGGARQKPLTGGVGPADRSTATTEDLPVITPQSTLVSGQAVSPSAWGSTATDRSQRASPTSTDKRREVRSARRSRPPPKAAGNDDISPPAAGRPGRSPDPGTYFARRKQASPVQAHPRNKPARRHTPPTPLPPARQSPTPPSPVEFPPISELPPLPEDSPPKPDYPPTEDLSPPESGIAPGTRHWRRNRTLTPTPARRVAKRAVWQPVVRSLDQLYPVEPEAEYESELTLPESPTFELGVPPDQDSYPSKPEFEIQHPGPRPGEQTKTRRRHPKPSGRKGARSRPRAFGPTLTSWTSIATLDEELSEATLDEEESPEAVLDQSSSWLESLDDLTDSETPTPEPDDPAESHGEAPFAIPANSLVSKNYLRSTGRGALAALIGACRRIQLQLQRVRRALVLQTEGVLTSLHHIRMLLGQTR
ncbi:large tegument protein [Bovine alphaherpesvirus 2]|uniref:Large tegument protein n=1 Tax=Bovine alphaherpesvirus 2 TaxID=10295 RepID=A0A7T1L7K9_9ALPH|nr:large tegument protein [Bovine alphaherpesvirus 2]